MKGGNKMKEEKVNGLPGGPGTFSLELTPSKRPFFDKGSTQDLRSGAQTFPVDIFVKFCKNIQR